MELKEMIKVMQHYDNGGEVEYSEDHFRTIFSAVNKKRNGDLSWDWSSFKYRIKEKKQIREEDKNHIEYAFRNKVKLSETYEVEL